MTVTRNAWTLLGMFTIPLWGTWPALATQIGATPPLEFLTLSFAAAALILWPLERRNEAAHLRTAWLISVTFGLAEVGSATLFLVAIRFIAPAEANMVVYLWPAMTSVMAMSLGIHAFGWRPVVGIVLGLFGTLLLFARGAAWVLNPWGLIAALAAGFSWALYVLLRLHWQQDVGAFLARGAGVAAFVCALLHVASEPTQVPGTRVWYAALGVGALPTAIANIFWDLGIRHGDSQLLTAVAYATPLCGAVLLALLGLEPFTWRLLIVGALIGIAGLLSRQAGGPEG